MLQCLHTGLAPQAPTLQIYSSIDKAVGPEGLERIQAERGGHGEEDREEH